MKKKKKRRINTRVPNPISLNRITPTCVWSSKSNLIATSKKKKKKKEKIRPILALNTPIFHSRSSISNLSNLSFKQNPKVLFGSQNAYSIRKGNSYCYE
jgi:hypothetical protein